MWYFRIVEEDGWNCFSTCLILEQVRSRGGSRKNERGGLVERGEAPYEGGGARGEIFCFLQFAHTFTFDLSYS